MKSLYKVSLLTLALIAWLACFLHPLPLHYPSITPPLPIHYPSITPPLPLHYHPLPIHYPSITPPGKGVYSRWRASLTFDTYFFCELLKCSLLLTNNYYQVPQVITILFTGRVRTISIYPSVNSSQSHVHCCTRTVLSWDYKITLHNPEIICAILTYTLCGTFTCGCRKGREKCSSFYNANWNCKPKYS